MFVTHLEGKVWLPILEMFRRKRFFRLGSNNAGALQELFRVRLGPTEMLDESDKAI